MKREYGSRPVILIGYSMGARLIFSCLSSLANAQEEWEDQQNDDSGGGLGQGGPREARKPNPAAGIIHTVVMLGAPVTVDKAAWRRARSVVSDRLVNCYSRKDWMLGLIYRYQKMTLSASGYSGDVKVPGVENIDVSRIIGGHQEYSTKIQECLHLVGLDDSCANASSFRYHPPTPPRRRSVDQARTSPPVDTVLDTNEADVDAADVEEEYWNAPESSSASESVDRGS